VVSPGEEGERKARRGAEAKEREKKNSPRMEQKKKHNLSQPRFLDRLATHILAFEGDSKVVWFEGGYSEYEADFRKRTGNVDPTRVKYRKMATV
jgi:hypothetical protein